MYNISSIIKSRWHQTLSKLHIVYKVIVRRNSEITVNLEPKYNCKNHLSSYVDNWQNTLQQDVDILREKNSNIRWFHSIRTLDLIVLYSECGDVVNSLNANCKHESSV